MNFFARGGCLTCQPIPKGLKDEIDRKVFAVYVRHKLTKKINEDIASGEDGSSRMQVEENIHDRMRNIYGDYTPLIEKPTRKRGMSPPRPPGIMDEIE